MTRSPSAEPAVPEVRRSMRESHVTSLPLLDGRYQLRHRLGAGTMGIVYRADDVMLQRPAAVKMIEPHLAQSKEAVDHFLSEARALARLRHDNVVQIYAFGSSGSSYFFAMEYVDGADLHTLLEAHAAEGKSFPLTSALEILGKVASGLSAAHARSLVHRDVKPANIVIERDTGRPVLLDFGIARHLGGEAGPSPQLSGGTPAYMAPEQVRDLRDLISERTDVYALACTAYEVLLGRCVFEAEDAYDVMRAHVTEAPPLPSRIRPDYAPFDAVFARALAKEPRFRHASCTEFVTDLVKAAEAGGLLAPESLPRAAAGGMPVLVLAGDDGFRRAIVRETTRAFQKVGQSLAITCITDPSDVIAAVNRQQPGIVVLDDDQARGGALALARAIRQQPGAPPLEVLVLTRDMLAERGIWEWAGARRLAKPLSTRALAEALDGICAKLLVHPPR